MESWRSRVHQRTEADFIPWFTGYWTQQWLAIKVGWYKLSAGEERQIRAVKRLAAYLQEQYHDRVLAPVAKEIDPDLVREQATKLYVQFLGEQLQEIPRRYGVPSDQFDRRLKDIPAIALAPHPAHSASLYQIVHADSIAKLPAYVALIDQIRKDAGGAGERTIGRQDIASGEKGQRKTGGQACRQRWRKRCRCGGRWRRRRDYFPGRGRFRRYRA